MSLVALVRGVIIVEVAAAVVLIVALLLSAARRARQLADRTAVRAAVQRMVASGLDGKPWNPEDAELVRRAARADVVRAVTDFAQSVGGADRRLLADIARSTGLLVHANNDVTDERWWRRLSGARLLTLFGVSEQQARALLADAHPRVRAQGATAAASWPFPGVAEALLPLLHDPVEMVRFAGKQAFVQLGPSAISAVTAELRATDGTTMRGGAAALLELAASMATPDMCDVALRFSEAADAVTRRAAARLLAAVGGPDAAQRLRGLLSDEDAAVRAAAAHALGALGEWRSAPAIAVHLDDECYRVRVAAAAALQQLGAPGTLVLRRSSATGTPRAAAMAQQTLEIVERLSTGAARA